MLVVWQKQSPVGHSTHSNLLRFASNCPRGKTENGHAVSQNGGPPGVMSSMNPPDGGELPAPRQGGSKESWVIRLARKVRRKFETSI